MRFYDVSTKSYEKWLDKVFLIVFPLSLYNFSSFTASVFFVVLVDNPGALMEQQIKKKKRKTIQES